MPHLLATCSLAILGTFTLFRDWMTEPILAGLATRNFLATRIVFKAIGTSIALRPRVPVVTNTLYSFGSSMQASTAAAVDVGP